jgi:phage gpG-like protein
MFSIQFTGAKQLRSAIQQLNKFAKGSNAQLQTIMMASVLDVLTGATQNAPYKSGTLRRSLTPKVEVGNSEIVGYVGSNLVYSRIQELGGRAGRGGSVNIRPKRYLQRSVESNKPRIAERFRKLKLVGG